MATMGQLQDRMSKDAALAAYGTIARYRAHVDAARADRLAWTLADSLPPGGWTLEDCTCRVATLRNAKGAKMFGELVDIGPDGRDAYDPVRRVHGLCGGDPAAPMCSVSGRASARVDEAMDGCACPGHAWDEYHQAVGMLREAIERRDAADAAWDALSPREQGEKTRADERSTVRASVHLGGAIQGRARGMLALLARIRGASQDEVDAMLDCTDDVVEPAPEPMAEGISSILGRCADPSDAHTCGPRREGETHRQASARSGRNCPACASAREAIGYGCGLVPYSLPELMAGVIRGDRLARQGRSPSLGTGQGGARIGQGSPLAD